MTNASEPGIRELLAATSTPTLTHLLGERGYRNVFLGGLHPLGNAQRAIGQARTLRYTPHRPDLMPADLACNPQRLAIESIEPGEVLVVETGGELGAGVLGDILLSRVVKRGGAAFVVDGAVRDAGEIRQFKIPVFVRGGPRRGSLARAGAGGARRSDPLRWLHRDDGRLDRVR